MKVAIIGAGAAGLSAAYDLTRAGHAVTIYEAAPTVGGLAGGFKAPHWDWTLEKFYHHWFASDKSILGLIKELGWTDRVLFPRPYTAVFLLAAIFPHQSLGLFHRWIEPRLPAPMRAKIAGIVVSFWAGLESLRSPFNILMVLVTSVVIWLLETVKYWFVMHAFSFEVSFFALMLMNGIVNLATTIPSAPGYLGTFDKSGSAVLAAFGVNPAVATGYTLVLHAALWLPITLLGVVYMMTEGVKWNDLQQAEQLSQTRSDI